MFAAAVPTLLCLLPLILTPLQRVSANFHTVFPTANTIWKTGDFVEMRWVDDNLPPLVHMLPAARIELISDADQKIVSILQTVKPKSTDGVKFNVPMLVMGNEKKNFLLRYKDQQGKILSHSPKFVIIDGNGQGAGGNTTSTKPVVNPKNNPGAAKKVPTKQTKKKKGAVKKGTGKGKGSTKMNAKTGAKSSVRSQLPSTGSPTVVAAPTATDNVKAAGGEASITLSDIVTTPTTTSTPASTPKAAETTSSSATTTDKAQGTPAQAATVQTAISDAQTDNGGAGGGNDGGGGGAIGSVPFTATLNSGASRPIVPPLFVAVISFLWMLQL